MGLPAADALDGAEVRAEEVDWDGGTAYRYAVPEEVADAAMVEGDATRVHSFTVDDDGELVALTVDDGRATQQYALSDWNQIEPAEAPEEVAEGGSARPRPAAPAAACPSPPSGRPPCC